jgi:hypothetical protein
MLDLVMADGQMRHEAYSSLMNTHGLTRLWQLIGGGRQATKTKEYK